MAQNKLQITFEGFDMLLKSIEEAGGSIEKSITAGMKKAADIQAKELRAQMSKSNVDGGLIDRMPASEIEWSGNTCTARVGYKKGSYDPNNLSDGYKAIFINYGTPRIAPREFIKKAKRKAKPEITKAEEEILNKILESLKR